MILIVIIFSVFQQIIAQNYNFTEYTHISRALDGTPCLTGCSPDNTCVINWQWAKRDCRTYDVAPIYHTSRLKDPTSKYCLSNCGLFGENSEWCITTVDLKWDYCSTYDSKTFLTSKKPVARVRNGYTMCNDECRFGTDNDKYYWCHYSSGNEVKWEYCAPPILPRVPVLSENFFTGDKNKGNCDGFLKYVSDCPDTVRATDAADDYVTGIADAIDKTTQENSMKRVITVYDESLPIDSYTMITVANISVPAVIRAHITHNVTLYPQQDVAEEFKRKVRIQMAGTTYGYEAAPLIGFQMGGPNAGYNIVPRNVNWRDEQWWDMELAIKSWCETTGGSVDMTVVVFYQDSNTPIPWAFGVSMIFKNADNSQFVECREKIHYNNL